MLGSLAMRMLPGSLLCCTAWMLTGAAMSEATPITATTGQDHAHRLALRPKEAALALGIGERLLWSLTNCGEIPHVRLGRAIVYPVDVLREWLAKQAGGQAKGDGRR